MANREEPDVVQLVVEILHGCESLAVGALDDALVDKLEPGRCQISSTVNRPLCHVGNVAACELRPARSLGVVSADVGGNYVSQPQADE